MTKRELRKLGKDIVKEEKRLKKLMKRFLRSINTNESHYLQFEITETVKAIADWREIYNTETGRR